MTDLEKAAKLIYQYSELIDDSEIDNKWYWLTNRERWFDCAEKVIQIFNSNT